MNKNIIIKTQFEAVHVWEDCNLSEVNYLAYPHRHIFYVTMKWKVEGNNREKEFISMKHRVNAFLREGWEANRKAIGLSCEDFAEILLERFEANYVSVFEDNENGAEVYV